MKYIVSINYTDFMFDSLSDACTFCALAKENGEKDVSVQMEFINEEENNK